MKKATLIILAALLCLTLVVPAFAADPDLTIEFDYVLGVSTDSIGDGISVTWGSTPELPVDTREAVIPSGTEMISPAGWVVADKEIVAYSFAINGGSVTKSADFVVRETGEGLDAHVAANFADAEDYSRFSIAIPVSDGTQIVRMYVEFADGTHEPVGMMKLTVGDETEINDLGDTYTAGTVGEDNTGADNTDGNLPDNNDTVEDNSQENAGTGDSFSVMFMIAAASVAAAVLMKKRAF